MFGNVLRRGLHFLRRKNRLEAGLEANDKVYLKCTEKQIHGTTCETAIGKA